MVFLGCSFPDYLYPYGEEYGDKVLLYNSSTSSVLFKVQNVLNMFGSEIDTVYVSLNGVSMSYFRFRKNWYPSDSARQIGPLVANS